LSVTFTVTITDDKLDSTSPTATLADMGGPGDLSLREAVFLANLTPGADTIVFASGPGQAFAIDAVIRLVQSEIEITEALTIDGSTAGGQVVITGDANGDDVLVSGLTDVAASFGGTAGAADDLLDDNSRLFNITGVAAHTTFDSLILTGGRTTDFAAGGGAIRSFNSDVTLTNSTLSGNSTAGDLAVAAGSMPIKVT